MRGKVLRVARAA